MKNFGDICTKVRFLDFIIMKKNIGIVSYNINCNFTNYGSALQSWALSQAIDRMGEKLCLQSKLIDYCPAVMAEYDILHPFKNMWDTDEQSRRMVELTMPAIRENYEKFEQFYTYRFRRTKKKYHDNDFDSVVDDEEITSFVCGSDTIFCIDEFKGFVEGYWANFACMRGNAVAYAASFGDSHFQPEDYVTLDERLKNFCAIGLREQQMLPYVKGRVDVPVQRVVDPTLLLKREDYEQITCPRLVDGDYLLLYSRRYNKAMEDFAIRLAQEKNLKIVEISLRATNIDRGHVMMYGAGVEEFLSLIKYSRCVVTNSFHGMIMSVQFEKLFYAFSREQCDNKVMELLQLMGLSNRLLVTGHESIMEEIDYEQVQSWIGSYRNESLGYLKTALTIIKE